MPLPKGFKHTEETKQKIRSSAKDFNQRRLGEHWNWKGGDVGYQGLHKWVHKELGMPDTCEFCKKSGLSGRKIHWANKSREYKRESADWVRLCRSCHKNYDLQKLVI